jgi:hypothetical protein
MLTAKGDPMDRIIGLELGADDYLPKPFEPRELLARIRAVLRRRQARRARAPALRFGSLEIDRDARTVTVGDVPCELTSYQFDLLVTLAERAGRVLTREQIMEAVRGRELEAFDRSIDVHIGRIRAAIEQDVKNPRRIVTVRGSATCLPASRTACPTPSPASCTCASGSRWPAACCCSAWCWAGPGTRPSASASAPACASPRASWWCATGRRAHRQRGGADPARAGHGTEFAVTLDDGEVLNLELAPPRPSEARAGPRARAGC